MRISHGGLQLIAGFEGFEPYPYQDIAGHLTIGFGHKIVNGENFTKGITEEWAAALLRRDARRAENAVNRFVTVKLHQNNFDALCSLVYNIGTGAFAQSTLLRKINDRCFHQAAAEFLRWNRAGGKVSTGLINRRKIESELFDRVSA